MFDKEAFMADMFMELIRICDEESEKMRVRLVSEFGYVGSEWTKSNIRSGNSIITAFETENVRAFITEFGSGSLMANASENPFLEKYINDPMAFNTDRKAKGMKILRRGKDPYDTLNWDGGRNEYIVEPYGGSEPKGQSLEGIKIGRWKNGSMTVQPRKGNFILRRVLAEYKENVMERLAEWVESDICQYWISVVN